jgi:hypothetical protein
METSPGLFLPRNWSHHGLKQGSGNHGKHGEKWMRWRKSRDLSDFKNNREFGTITKTKVIFFRRRSIGTIGRVNPYNSIIREVYAARNYTAALDCLHPTLLPLDAFVAYITSKNGGAEVMSVLSKSR